MHASLFIRLMASCILLGSTRTRRACPVQAMTAVACRGAHTAPTASSCGAVLLPPLELSTLEPQTPAPSQRPQKTAHLAHARTATHIRRPPPSLPTPLPVQAAVADVNVQYAPRGVSLQRIVMVRNGGQQPAAADSGGAKQTYYDLHLVV